MNQSPPRILSFEMYPNPLEPYTIKKDPNIHPPVLQQQQFLQKEHYNRNGGNRAKSSVRNNGGGNSEGNRSRSRKNSLGKAFYQNKMGTHLKNSTINHSTNSATSNFGLSHASTFSHATSFSYGSASHNDKGVVLNSTGTMSNTDMQSNSTAHSVGGMGQGRIDSKTKTSMGIVVGGVITGTGNPNNGNNTGGATKQNVNKQKNVSLSNRDFADACRFGNLNVVRIMLKEHVKNMSHLVYADLASKSEALHHAANATQNSYEIVNFLLDNGFNPNVRMTSLTKLQIEALKKEKRTPIIRDINGRVVQYNNPNLEPSNQTPLTTCVKRLRQGTASSWVTERDSLGVIRLLIRSGTNVNAKDNCMRTALFWAAKFNNIDVCRELLILKADLNLYDRHGKRPIDVTTKEAVRVLLAEWDNNPLNPNRIVKDSVNGNIKCDENGIPIPVNESDDEDYEATREEIARAKLKMMNPIQVTVRDAFSPHVEYLLRNRIFQELPSTLQIVDYPENAPIAIVKVVMDERITTRNQNGEPNFQHHHQNVNVVKSALCTAQIEKDTFIVRGPAGEILLHRNHNNLDFGGTGIGSFKRENRVEEEIILDALKGIGGTPMRTPRDESSPTRPFGEKSIDAVVTDHQVSVEMPGFDPELQTSPILQEQNQQNSYQTLLSPDKNQVIDRFLEGSDTASAVNVVNDEELSLGGGDEEIWSRSLSKSTGSENSSGTHSKGGQRKNGYSHLSSPEYDSEIGEEIQTESPSGGFGDRSYSSSSTKATKFQNASKYHNSESKSLAFTDDNQSKSFASTAGYVNSIDQQVSDLSEFGDLSYIGVGNLIPAHYQDKLNNTNKELQELTGQSIVLSKPSDSANNTELTDENSQLNREVRDLTDITQRKIEQKLAEFAFSRMSDSEKKQKLEQERKGKELEEQMKALERKMGGNGGDEDSPDNAPRTPTPRPLTEQELLEREIEEMTANFDEQKRKLAEFDSFDIRKEDRGTQRRQPPQERKQISEMQRPPKNPETQQRQPLTLPGSLKHCEAVDDLDEVEENEIVDDQDDDEDLELDNYYNGKVGKRGYDENIEEDSDISASESDIDEIRERYGIINNET